MRIYRFFLIIVFGLLSAVTAQAQSALDYTEARYFGTGQWDADSLGNHRVLLRVDQAAEAVLARIPWRRRDAAPEKKAVIVVDEQTGARIANVQVRSVTRALGEVVFEPVSGPGRYFVYYLPYFSTGSRNYPKGAYRPPEETADPAWLAGLGTLPEATLEQFQSIDAFNSFYPMEVIATTEEVHALVAEHRNRDFLLFPEDRTRSIRMTRDLPCHWVRQGLKTAFQGEADRFEYYTFQVGVFAARNRLNGLSVDFSALEGPGGARIDKAALTCFNTEGRDWIGRPFRKTIAIDQGRVQALWMGVDVPRNAAPGLYRGRVTVSAAGMKPETVEIALTVSAQLREDRGDDEMWRLSRLRWLNSRLADDNSVVPPFTPLTVDGKEIRCLGRQVVLNDLGLPRRITSYFAPEMTSILDKGRKVLAGGVHFIAKDQNGKAMKWKAEGIRVIKKAEGAVAWIAQNSAGPLHMDLSAQMEFDGCVEYDLAVTASERISIDDFRLDVPMRSDVAKYMMGMAFKGNDRPDTFDWKWNRERNQDALWVGDVNAGLQVSFRDRNYVRPLNTNFYQLKPLNLPPAWHNNGAGGFRLSTEKKAVHLTAYSGARTVAPGDTLHFQFRLLVTPFKPLDTQAHWANRYYHRYNPIDTIAAAGANVINVHHATAINPYINYPFFVPDSMKAYIDAAHDREMRVKIYYTVRELCNRAPELFALFSLGDEVLSHGPGGGFSWLQEHLDGDYIAGWLVPTLKDAAIINSGVSRWHNFYLEGLDWLVRHMGIDGLYIDDVAFDRTVMQRVRRILDRSRPAALIDLHSANQYNIRDGFASSANLYMEHFPYLNRLWFGEYFDYGSQPQYWLTEISGIPFGLMGEMLQDGGNPWRGMVYGMTSRLPWAGNPRPLWAVWDAFGMETSEMIGYWVEESPVKTGHPQVLATVYKREGKAMIALASWADGPVDVRLHIDLKKLKLSSRTLKLKAPPIKDFQVEESFDLQEKITVAPGKGWLLILESE